MGASPSRFPISGAAAPHTPHPTPLCPSLPLRASALKIPHKLAAFKYNISMNLKAFRLALASALCALLPDANAWMSDWAPEFQCTPAEVQTLSGASVSNYVCAVQDNLAFSWQYCEGYALDLNGDGINDQVFFLPWMGNGLSADGYNVHFIVSDGAKGWTKTVMEGYGVTKSDLVKVADKTYFRHSAFFNEFEKSKHNHWVYQVFSFDKKGVMKCGNKDFGKLFPAVTIYYVKPRFKQIDLTRRDRRKIADETMPDSL
ncbi:MAG: hypothetical protein IJQ73_00620 [Kiritimatiellae bacterium]|nr:hypothetical protein [Kiritimatiellia bacterium]